MKRRSAFTMIELIFVIVILGILASVGISKMAVTRDDAMMVKGRSDVSSIRSSISLLHSTNMMSGVQGWPTSLDHLTTTTSSDGDSLFDYDSVNNDATKKLLDYPIISKNANGHWRKTAKNKYTFKLMGSDVAFTYDGAGKFDCDSSTNDAKAKLCKQLTQ